jgi:hypothetical protein
MTHMFATRSAGEVRIPPGANRFSTHRRHEVDR